jgi:dTDP-4-amino-4,6-dideoxygalactose transaminase
MNTHPIPLLDLRAQHATIREEAMEAVTRVIDSQLFILGAEVEELEREIAAYCASKHAVGCASGTDALLLALMALDIGAGDEVITTPYSFFATVSTIVRAGARPVFVDIDPRSFNLDTGKLAEAVKEHPKAKAILPVHLFGQCADMDPILRIAEAARIPVIEDAAQSIGSEYKGRRAGSMGVMGCFSFFPSKNLGGYGDGGMITTGDEKLAHRLKSLRVHGSHVKYWHEEVGLNSRLDSLQAAVLRVKLRHLDAWSAARALNADRYRERLSRGAVLAPVRFPCSTRHIYNQFVIRTPRRDELAEFLRSKGIGCEVYYPVPLHLQPCFAFLGYTQGDLPVSEACAKDSLALPVFAELPQEDLERVCAVIGEFHAGRTAGSH